MRTKLKIFCLPALLAMFALMQGCIKEEPDNCGKYLWFVHNNPKYSYPETVSDMLLLVYDHNGNLIDEHTWSRSSIIEAAGKVFVPAPPTGSGRDYTLIALFNVNEDRFSLDGTGSLETLKYSLVTDNDSIKQYFDGNAYARKDNVVFSNAENTYDTLQVSKNSNYINLNLRIKNYDLHESAILAATLMCKNTIYDDDNLNIDERDRTYLHYRITDLPEDPVISLEQEISLKTMRIWLAEENKSGRTYADDGLRIIVWHYIKGEGFEILSDLGHVTRDIIAKKQDGNGNYVFDTNEKLEIEDEFDIDLELEHAGGKWAIISLSIDDWSLIEQGIILN